MIIEYDDGGRRGFYLKWVDAPASASSDRAVYKIHFRQEDIESLLNDKYDHLCIHLGDSEYPFCILTRAEFRAMRVGVGGYIILIYERGQRKFRLAGGVIPMHEALRVELRRFWHSAPKVWATDDARNTLVAAA